MEELKSIFIEGTLKSPRIEFNHLKGELILSGRSYPENSVRIYEPLLFWINDYIKSPPDITNFHLKLEYFNTSSLLWIVQIVKALCKIDKDNSALVIHLYFDEEDYDARDAEELRDILVSQVDKSGELKIKISIKTHGSGEND